MTKIWHLPLLVFFSFCGCSNLSTQVAGQLALIEAKCAFEDNFKVGSKGFQDCIAAKEPKQNRE